jgi:hypothetical protein
MVRGWGGGRQRIDKGVGGYATAFCVETLKDAMARDVTIRRAFLRYFSSTHRTDLSRFRGTFHSFDPVGFAIFAILELIDGYFK